MTIKEQLIRQINEISESESESLLKELLEIIETKKPKRTFKNRPLLRPEDMAKMECPFPPEPEWEALWEEREKE